MKLFFAGEERDGTLRFMARSEDPGAIGDAFFAVAPGGDLLGVAYEEILERLSGSDGVVDIDEA